MGARLLAAVALLAGVALSCGASATPLCSSFATLGALSSGGGACLDDADQDLLLNFVSTTLPSTTKFEVVEFESAGVDLYAVNLDFPGGLSPSVALTFDFTLTTQGTNPIEFLNGGNFDTVVQGRNFLATADLSDGGGTFLTLTSTNGSRDPAQNETPFNDRSFVYVHDTLNPGTGLYTSASNSFSTHEVIRRLPEPGTLALLGLGLLGLASRRRQDR